MRATRPLKKNGSIDVRLPDQVKTAFMEHCRSHDRTASDAIRTFIDEQLTSQEIRYRPVRSFWRAGVAAVVGAAIGMGAAAPSIANSMQRDRTMFQQLDRDRNGTLTYQEFRAG